MPDSARTTLYPSTILESHVDDSHVHRSFFLSLSLSLSLSPSLPLSLSLSLSLPVKERVYGR